jgi:hypothetical protein
MHGGRWGFTSIAMGGVQCCVDLGVDRLACLGGF